MNSNNDDGTLFKLICLGLLVYAGVQVVKSVVAAITALLMGLVNIALVAGGILALFFVYRYITDKQYGNDKRMREAQKLERERIRAVSQAPEHMKQGIDAWYQQRQEAIFESRSESRFDSFADRTKQVFNIFRRGE